MFPRIRRLTKTFLTSSRTIDVERAILVTEAYRGTEGESPVIRKAKALDKILSKMKIKIVDGELIVGNQTSIPKAAPLFPEYGWNWILEQMNTFSTRKGDQFLITTKQKQILKEILPYWKGKSLKDVFLAAVPKEIRDVLDSGVIVNENYIMSGPGHTVPDYEKVLSKGFIGLKKEIHEKIKKLKAEDPWYSKKHVFYNALLITCDASIKFADRYACLAEKLAKKQASIERKAELEKIAEICRKVPAHAATTFYEALQSFWFQQVIIQIESNGLAIAPGRFDQYMYPFYKYDLEKGEITNEKALELLESLFIKFNEIDKIYSNEATRFLQGPAHGQTLTLAGVTRNGQDATNELSYLCLTADRDVALVQPDLAIRVSEKTPEEFLMRICENIGMRLGKPKLFNDNIVIDSLLNLHIPLEEARDWAALGCTEPAVCGKTYSGGNFGQINIAKCLELALNDGTCQITDKKIGVSTGNPNHFSSFDEVLEAFKSQLQYFIDRLVILDNTVDLMHAEMLPLPFYSLVLSDCLDRGEEFCAGGARYNFTSPAGVGFITTADSLAAIKALVFNKRRISMEDLTASLQDNFEEHEEQRILMRESPKFGNDDDSIDLLANDLLNIFSETVMRYQNPRGGIFVPGLYSLTANIPFGSKTGATPDGRRAYQPLNDGGISPVHGMDARGPTAVARSVGKLDHIRVPHGSLLNMRFTSMNMKDNEMMQRFTSFVRVLMELGAWHCQFNMISSAILRDAQKNPEKYKNLIIRVAGYSAYFAGLEKEVQDDIIARKEHILN